MDKNLKLLLISNLFPNPQEPLRGVFIFNISRELRKMCDLTVVSPLPWVPAILGKLKKYKRFASIPKLFEMGDIKVCCPKYVAVPKFGALHPVFMFFSLLPKVYRLKKTAKVSVINTQCVFPDGVAAGWIARFLNLPLVLSALGTDVNLYSTYRYRRPQIIKALKKSDKITVVSDAQKQVVRNLGIDKNKIVVIKNGVDLERFNIKNKAECRQRLNLENNCKFILFAGRLEEVKGVNYLIDAFVQLVKEGKKHHLIIIGEGSLKEKYIQQVSAAGLGDYITFVGEKSQDELPLWYGACDLFCLPSKMEGCPNVIMEALASGRPVVASRIGGIPELVNEKNGMLFEAGNACQLAEALESIILSGRSETEIRDSIKSRNWENTAEQYLEACCEAIKEFEYRDNK